MNVSGFVRAGVKTVNTAFFRLFQTSSAKMVKVS